MHERFAKDGLVCLSVCVGLSPDQPERERQAALKFLKLQRATFANYWLDEPDVLWTEKFGINGPPAVFVFDRGNRRAARFDYSDPNRQYSYADIAQLVQQLLKER